MNGYQIGIHKITELLPAQLIHKRINVVSRSDSSTAKTGKHDFRHFWYVCMSFLAVSMALAACAPSNTTILLLLLL